MNQFDSLPMGTDPYACRYCFSPVIKAASLDYRGVQFHGRAVAPVCPEGDHFAHASCLNQHFKTPNTTTADYGDDFGGLTMEQRTIMLEVDAVANAPAGTKCISCTHLIDGFKDIFYVMSDKDMLSLEALEELHTKDIEKVNWAINNNNMQPEEAVERINEAFKIMLNKTGYELWKKREIETIQAKNIAPDEQNFAEHEDISDLSEEEKKKQQEDVDFLLALSLQEEQFNVTAEQPDNPPIPAAGGAARQPVNLQEAAARQPQPAPALEPAAVQQQPRQEPIYERVIRRVLQILAPVCRIL